MFSKVRELGHEDPQIIAGEVLALKQQGLYNQALQFFSEARENTRPASGPGTAARRFLPGRETLDQTSIIGGEKGFMLAIGPAGQVVFASVSRLVHFEIESGSFKQTHGVSLKAGQARALSLSRDLTRILTGGADEHLRYWMRPPAGRSI